MSTDIAIDTLVAAPHKIHDPLSVVLVFPQLAPCVKDFGNLSSYCWLSLSNNRRIHQSHLSEYTNKCQF